MVAALLEKLLMKLAPRRRIPELVAVSPLVEIDRASLGVEAYGLVPEERELVARVVAEARTNEPTFFPHLAIVASSVPRMRSLETSPDRRRAVIKTLRRLYTTDR